MTRGLHEPTQVPQKAAEVLPVAAAHVVNAATVMGKMTTSAVASYATAGAVAEENLGNMRTVAAFGGEQQAIDAFGGHVKKARSTGIRLAHVSGANIGLMMMVMFASYSLGFWYGGKMITDPDRLINTWTGEQWTGGDVLATFFAALMGGMMLGQMGPTAAATTAAKGAAARMFSILGETPTIDNASDAGEVSPSAAVPSAPEITRCCSP